MRFDPTVLVLLGMTACAAESDNPTSSAAYKRYIARQHDYIASVSELPVLAAQVEGAKRTIASMPDDAIVRLDTLGYPLLIAAGNEIANRTSWTSRGTDWTRYEFSHGCCRSVAESTAFRLKNVRAICAAIQFRSMRGRVTRAARKTRPEPQSAVGIIPFGTDSYRGTLVGDGDERAPVTWQREWSGERGNPITDDPLDDAIHDFALQRLPGAENWTLAGWSGGDDPDYADGASCLTALTRQAT